VPRQAAPFCRGVKIYYRCRQRVTAIVGMCFIADVSGDVADLGKEIGGPRIKEEASGLYDGGMAGKVFATNRASERVRASPLENLRFNESQIFFS